MVSVKMKHRDEGSFEEIDESVAEQAERRAKVTHIFCLFACFLVCLFGDKSVVWRPRPSV